MNASMDGIAIIGLSGRFPGAENVEELWTNLLDGKETLSFFKDAQLTCAGVDLDEIRRRGNYVPARGTLEDIEYFDAAFFGVQPTEAEIMDPQHRLFLEGAWEALERAGYAPNRLPGLVGVFTAATYNTYYQNVLSRRRDLIERMGSLQTAIGNEKDYLATRVAYKLNLKGPAINVDTACSGSLVSVCLACQALLTYQCDMALAGGVSVKVPQEKGHFHYEGGITSPDGHTRTFDSRARGTTFSNGMGIVVLKRLADAVRDDDELYAVIKGSAVNNDGSQRASFVAPGVEGQAEVIALAHAIAGFAPDTVSYIEAHGTATELGDAIELASLTKAFRTAANSSKYCAIGSVKTNIGHLDAAAGVTGLIKTALSLKHKKLPASLHFSEPNPKLNLECSPFYVNERLREWHAEGAYPRRAGVSSFGTGGTNAHVALEEAPELQPAGSSRPCQLLLLSAPNRAQLEQVQENLRVHLAAQPDLDLADVAFTLQSGRAEFSERKALVCQNSQEALALLTLRSGGSATAAPDSSGPRTVFLFPGQGSQYVNMGVQLYGEESVFRETIDWASKILTRVSDIDLRKVLCPESDDEQAEQQLLQTSVAQPALFAVEYALAKLWMSWGIRPAAMIGHSLGEYVAASLAGVFAPEDALLLVAERGRLVQAQPPGRMLAVRLSEQDILPHIKGELALAAVNAPALCVVSGPEQEMQILEELFRRKNVSCQPLHTSHAFHSRMMDPAVPALQEMLERIELHEPTIPFVSNVTGRWISAAEAQDPTYWASHLRQTVRFAEGAAEILDNKDCIALEVGPGHTLTTFVLQNPAKTPESIALNSLSRSESDFKSIFTALGRLWTSGVKIDCEGFWNGHRRRRIVLPTYPFARQFYWPAPENGLASASVASAHPPALPPIAPVPSNDSLSEASPGPATPIARKEYLLSIVIDLLEGLCGKAIERRDSLTSLLELGFDSLMLTQASQLFQRKFNIPVKFRQLMGELSTPDSLAGYLDKELPQGQWAPEQPPVNDEPQTQPQVNNSSEIEKILQQQLQMTSQLLDWMKKHKGESGSSTPDVRASLVDSTAAATKQMSHGPFRPIETASGDVLTTAQQEALDNLIQEYTRRTPGSKRFAQNHRNRLADPRAASGFKHAWKEMVYPIVVSRSEGPKVWDVDNNEYVDFVMGFGASLFGHRPSFVVQAVEEQLRRGFEIGPMTALAAEVADLISEFTGMERVSFCNTGSEAVMAAIRLARTVTGRDRIALFSGSYHGIFDEVLVRGIGAGPTSRSAPIAPGILQDMVDHVLVLRYGDPEALDLLRREGPELACVLVEPVQSRRLDLQPEGFLKELSSITQQTGTALVFDEVVTGFRAHPGGAQKVFGVQADLATYGKVLGGGLPIGVVAGRSRFMDALDGGHWNYGDQSFPEVGVTFFAGTFVRHPLALAAAKAVLLHLKERGERLQADLNDQTKQLVDRLRSCLDKRTVPMRLTHFSSLIGLTNPPELRMAGLLYHHLRARGIHIWENRNFVLTTAHTEEDLDRFVTAFDESLDAMQCAGFLPGKTESPPTSVVALKQNLQVTPTLPADPVVLPLTPAQKELWVTALLADDASRALNNALVIHIRGNVDIGLLTKSLQVLVDRHDSLRTSFDTHEPRQLIHQQAKLDVPVVDWRDAVPDQRQQDLAVEQAQLRRHTFNLTQAPLLTARIIQMSAVESLLLLNLHHLVSDGWSIGVVLDELKQLYKAESASEPVLLGPAMQFTEYLQHRQTLAFAKLEREANAYWLAQFGNVPLAIELPADHLRPATKTFQGAREVSSLNADLYREIKKTSAALGSTTTVFLLASFKVLLFRLTSQEDLVVGVPAAGQIAPDLQDQQGGRRLVGHCVNFLPIRSQCLRNESFSTYLQRLQSLTLDAYEHQAFTFGSLVEELSIPRDQSRFPIVSVIFNLDQANLGFELSGLQTQVETLAREFVVFDLEMNLIDTGREILVECTFNRDLFDPSTVHRWLGHWQRLLREVTRNPKEDIARIPILEKEERHRILTEWNATQTEYPSKRLVHELVEHQVGRTPERIAVECGSKQLTYRSLNERANQIARRLNAMAVRTGDLVGICVERSTDMVAAVLGVLKAGAAYVPLDPSHPVERLRFVVQDAGIKVVLGDSRALDALPDDPFMRICLDEAFGAVSKLSKENLEVTGTPAGLAYVLYTSGSTGKPKGVEIPHRALVNLLSSVRCLTGISQDDILVAITTLSFDIATLEVLLPLTVGAKVVVAQRRVSADGSRLAEFLDKTRATMLQATPATWRLLVDAGWKGKQDLRIISGGEELPSRLATQLLQRVKTLWNLYGPTETTIYSTGEEVRKENELITIGKPIANTQVYILDSQLEPVPIGVAGELCIGGDGLARGYLGRPELTAERFVDNPGSDLPARRLYRTGDLARYRTDGRIEFLGRMDRQLKIRGFRIEPGEIEAVLSDYPDVRQVVVLARNNASAEKNLVAYFTAGEIQLSLSDVRKFLRQRLPVYMIPVAFVQLDEFPMNSNGKVDRTALPAPGPMDLSGKKDYRPPRDRLELQLSRIWESLLRVERIGITDNFFELGGHSLLAVKLLAQVNRSTQRHLTLASVFQAPTIESMAKLIRHEGWIPVGQSLVEVQPGGSRPPFFCVHGYAGYHGLAAHLGSDQPFYGLIQGLDGTKFYTSVEDLASHYLKDVRAVCPKGPYFLGGHSFGGLVAFEMARKLREEGDEIGLLVLMDSTPPAGSAVEATENRVVTRVARNWRDFGLLSTSDKRVYLQERRARLKSSLSKTARQLVCEAYLKLGYSLPPSLRTFYIDKILFGRYYGVAAQQYQPKGCDLPALLIEAETSASEVWQQLIPHGLLIRQMPAKHMDMLNEPHVGILAGYLSDCLERVWRTKPAVSA